jgi:hypothetical protein
MPLRRSMSHLICRIAGCCCAVALTVHGGGGCGGSWSVALEQPIDVSLSLMR